MKNDKVYIVIKRGGGYVGEIIEATLNSNNNYKK